MEVDTQSSENTLSSTINEESLTNRDGEIFELILSSFDPYQLKKLSCEIFMDSHYFFHVWNQIWLNS